MAIYVYCRKMDTGLQLVKSLEANRLRRFDGESFWDGRSRIVLNEGDVVVCWGTSLPEMDGIKVLNGADIGENNYELHKKLEKAGTPNLGVRNDIAGRSGYMPRSFVAHNATDLLFGINHADYQVMRNYFVTEYVVHMFGHRTIHIGYKVHKEGFVLATADNPWIPNSNMIHPWIRTEATGWTVKYDEPVVLTAQQKKLLKVIMRVLNLTFGIITLGSTAIAATVPINVSKTPTEESLIPLYTRLIKKYIREDKEVMEEAMD